MPFFTGESSPFNRSDLIWVWVALMVPATIICLGFYLSWKQRETRRREQRVSSEDIELSMVAQTHQSSSVSLLGRSIGLGSWYRCPSASHLPLPTVYTAATRKSARVPTMTTQTNAKEATTLSQAMHAFTAGVAYSRFAESWTGSLKPGMRADFVVMDHEWDAEQLRKGKVLQTWSKVQKVFQI